MASYQSTLNKGVDYAKDKADEYSATAEDMAKKAADQGAVAMKEAEKRIRQGADTATQMVREQPLATLAAVAGIAFAIGALWKTTSR